jgi:hypothetical protein
MKAKEKQLTRWLLNEDDTLKGALNPQKKQLAQTKARQYAYDTLFIGNTPDPVAQHIAVNVRNSVITLRPNEVIPYLESNNIYTPDFENNPENGLKIQNAFRRMATAKNIEDIRNEIVDWFSVANANNIKTGFNEFTIPDDSNLPENLKLNSDFKLVATYMLYQQKVFGLGSDMAPIGYVPPLDQNGEIVLKAKVLGL